MVMLLTFCSSCTADRPLQMPGQATTVGKRLFLAGSLAADLHSKYFEARLAQQYSRPIPLQG